MKLWKKLEIVENPPARLGPDDECYYARDYIARGGYQASEANQLIANLKKHPRFKNTPSWRYKQQAIERFAAELGGVLAANLTVAAIPPSKIPSDPEYDSRLADTLTSLSRLRPDLQIMTPFRSRASTTPAHHGGSREVDEILANLEWLGLPESCRLLVLIDDVLTTGGHFRACKLLVARHAPAVRVAGLFWARTVWDIPEPPAAAAPPSL